MDKSRIAPGLRPQRHEDRLNPAQREAFTLLRAIAQEIVAYDAENAGDLTRQALWEMADRELQRSAMDLAWLELPRRHKRALGDRQHGYGMGSMAIPKERK